MFRQQRYIWHPYIVRRNHLITFTSYVIHLCLSWFTSRGRRGYLFCSTQTTTNHLIPKLYKFTHFIDFNEMPLDGKLLATKCHIRKSTERVKVRFGTEIYDLICLPWGCWSNLTAQENRFARAAYILFICFIQFILTKKNTFFVHK